MRDENDYSWKEDWKGSYVSQVTTTYHVKRLWKNIPVSTFSYDKDTPLDDRFFAPKAGTNRNV